MSTNDLTLIEKIQREQAENAADLKTFLESEKQITEKDIQEIQEKESEIAGLIQKIAEKQEAE